MEPAASPLRSHLGRLVRRLPARFAGGPPLVVAAAGGDVARVASLLAGGAPIDAVNDHGQTALHVAARCGRIETAALLLARGASHAVGSSGDMSSRLGG